MHEVRKAVVPAGGHLAAFQGTVVEELAMQVRESPDGRNTVRSSVVGHGNGNS